MAEDFEQIGNFLSRWSRRKLEKTAPQAAPPAEPAADPAPDQAGVVPQGATSGEGSKPAQVAAELPSVDSLTPASDFTRFMQPDVDAGVKSAALKQLFKDPHFNVMDGLDTYIEDYSIADPIPDAMMKTMYQARQHLFSDEEKAAADAADAAQAAEHAAAEEAGKVDSDPSFEIQPKDG